MLGVDGLVQESLEPQSSAQQRRRYGARYTSRQDAWWRRPRMFMIWAGADTPTRQVPRTSESAVRLWDLSCKIVVAGASIARLNRLLGSSVDVTCLHTGSRASNTLYQSSTSVLVCHLLAKGAEPGVQYRNPLLYPSWAATIVIEVSSGPA